MMDIARYLVREKKVDEVIAVLRRGPTEVKFAKKELEAVARNLDLSALDAEFQRVAVHMEKVGQDVAAAKEALLSSLPKALEPVSDTRLRFEFLASPVRILGDWFNGISALKVEDNTLAISDGNFKAVGLGLTRQIEADTVIFAIGDSVDKDFCLPVYNNGYVTVSEPRFPVDGVSYEAFDPDSGKPLEKVFLAGWARQASTGLVGIARKDGESAAQAILQFLQAQPAMRDVENVFDKFAQRLEETHVHVISKNRLARLEEAERAESQKRGGEAFKFSTNEDMFTAMGF